MHFIKITDFATGFSKNVDIESITDSSGRVYQIVSIIAKGGNGTVFRVENKDSGRREYYAAKFLNINDDRRRARFYNEIAVLKTLKHPNILPLVGEGNFISDGTIVPFSIQNLGGINLELFVSGDLRFPPNPPLRGDHFKSISMQLCNAVKHIHEKGYIHRDLKPANIVWKDPDCREIALIDFGLANGETRSSAVFTMDNEIVGPRMLLSPELMQYSNDKTTLVDYRSDYWQLARIIWYLATGNLSSGRPSKKDDPTTGGLRTFVDVMISDDPDERIQTIDEIIEAIMEFEFKESD